MSFFQNIKADLSKAEGAVTSALGPNEIAAIKAAILPELELLAEKATVAIVISCLMSVSPTYTAVTAAPIAQKILASAESLVKSIVS